MKKIMIFILGISFFGLTFANIEIYFFHGEGCPYCTVQKGYFQELEQDYDFNIKEYEIYYNTDNFLLMQRFADAYKSNFNGVPVTIIGTDYFLGADKNQTEKLLKKYSSIGTYTDPYNIVLNYESKNTSKASIQEDGPNQIDEKIIEVEYNSDMESKDKKINSLMACISPWGKTIQHGKSILAYQSEFGFIDQPCLSQKRICNDGDLDGTYLHEDCKQQTTTLQEYEDLKNQDKVDLYKDFEESIDMKNDDYKKNNFIEKINYKIISIIVGFFVLIIGFYLVLFKPKK